MSSEPHNKGAPPNTTPVATTESTARFLLKTIVPLLGVALGSALTYYFVRHNTPAEQRLILHREVVNSQFLYLKKVKHFAELGMEMSVNLFHEVDLDSNGQVFAKGDTAILFPAVATVKEKQAEWHELAAEIQGDKKAIDISIYKPFQEVLDISTQHPWPPPTNLVMCVKSDWNTDELRGLWLTKNHYLALIVDRYLDLSN